MTSVGTTPCRWGVIGAGFLGMTIALRLAQQGHRVSLIDPAGTLGGVASAWRIGDVVWDRHYHVTLLSDTHLRSLLDEIGMAQEMQWRTTKTGFYTDATFYSLSNALEFLRFPPLGLVDKLRLGATIFYASRVKDWQSLEQVLVTDWLERWSGKRVLRKIWLPLLRSKLGDNYRDTSAAFIWATIARMYAARRAGMKTEMFGYIPGGYANVLERFAHVLDSAGVCAILGKGAKKVTSHAGEVEVELSNGNIEHYDNVVLTMAAPLAAGLCPQLTADERRCNNSIRYQGIICTCLLLEKPLSEFYITNITDPGLPFTAVIEMSALVDRKQFGGRSLVYLPKYLPSDSVDFALPDSDIEERFVSGLSRMHPKFSRKDVVAVRTSRVKYLLPLPTLNYHHHLPPIATSLPGVYMASSAHIVNGTLNINETIQLAERVAANINAPLVRRSRKSANDDYREAAGQSVA